MKKLALPLPDKLLENIAKEAEKQNTTSRELVQRELARFAQTFLSKKKRKPCQN